MNQKKLTKNAQSVQEVLNNEHLICKVVELPSSTKIANYASASIGCDIDQIIKSFIFKTQHMSKPFSVLVSGSNKVNEKQIKSYVGEGIVKTDTDFVKRITGFAIGGSPPIGHKTFDEVWAVAGVPNAVSCIKSKELVNITHGRVVQI